MVHPTTLRGHPKSSLTDQMRERITEYNYYSVTLGTSPRRSALGAAGSTAPRGTPPGATSLATELRQTRWECGQGRPLKTSRGQFRVVEAGPKICTLN